MVLNKLKRVRNELRDSAERYDNALKNIAVMAAEELVNSEQILKQEIGDRQTQYNLSQALDKQFFINKYGSLKNAKAAYIKIHGKQSFGRSWSDFLAVAKNLGVPEMPAITLEERITKIEKFLTTLGYQP